LGSIGRIRSRAAAAALEGVLDADGHPVFTPTGILKASASGKVHRVRRAFVCGGVDEATGHILTSVDMGDFEKQVWSMGPSMNARRSRHAAGMHIDRSAVVAFVCAQRSCACFF
jgi:hypothetical protein